MTVRNRPDEPTELQDLAADGYEEKDAAGEYPEVAANCGSFRRRAILPCVGPPPIATIFARQDPEAAFHLSRSGV